MKKLFLLVFSICFITPVLSQTDKRLKNIDKELNKILEATNAAGFAVAVVEGDKIVYAKGFGYRDVENKIPADANTLFAIGSSTKAFTSAVLGQLRADDKLSFNDSPRKHIPELEFFNDNMNNNIIIKDLMSHRTGLPRHDYSWYLFPTNDRASLMKRVKHQEPFTGIRQQWYYNNFMFLAQGVIAEKITGKSWEDNIRERFIKPLGMSRSNVTIDEMKTASNTAYGYETKKDNSNSKMDYYDIAAMAPAGSINSSVNDMSRWLVTWINKGKFNDEVIIPETYVNEARLHGGLIEAPCVNRSSVETCIDGKHIFLGFNLMQELEEKTIGRILSERHKNGDFESLQNFLDRVEISLDQLVILIRINAFRALNSDKKKLLWEAHFILGGAKKSAPVSDLFRTTPKKLEIPKLEYNQHENAVDEIEILGFPLTSPFDLVPELPQGTILGKDMINHIDKEVTMCGYLIHLRNLNTRSNNPQHMQFGCFFDIEGNFIDSVHFPQVAAKYKFQGRGVYLLKGRILEDFDFLNIEVNYMERLPYVDFHEV